VLTPGLTLELTPKLIHFFPSEPLSTKFYKNQLRFIDDMTKTFWLTFSVTWCTCT